MKPFNIITHCLKMAENCPNKHSRHVHCSLCHTRSEPKILMSGYLIKSPPLGKGFLHKWQKRYFILRANKTMEYYKNNKALDPIGTINISSTYRIEAGLEAKGYCNIFDIIAPQRTYIFSAVTAEIMFEWVKQIKNLVGIEEDILNDCISFSIPKNTNEVLYYYYVASETEKNTQPASPPMLHMLPSVKSQPLGAECHSSGSDEEMKADATSSIPEDDWMDRLGLTRSINYTTVTKRDIKIHNDGIERVPINNSRHTIDRLGITELTNNTVNAIEKFIKSSTEKPSTKFYSSEFSTYGSANYHEDNNNAAFKPTSSTIPNNYKFRKIHSPQPFPVPNANKEFLVQPFPVANTNTESLVQPFPVANTNTESLVQPFTVADSNTNKDILGTNKTRTIENSSTEPSKEDTNSQRNRLASLVTIDKIKISRDKNRNNSKDIASSKNRTSDSEIVSFGKIIKRVFDVHGGNIVFKDSNVEVEVPRNAITEGKLQGVYFKVSPDYGFLEEEPSSGITTHVCSPLVQFGPVGAKFNQPIKIKLPHCLNLDVPNYEVQLIFAYGDPFSPNGLNYLKIEANKDDFEMEMYTFTTKLGPVVFNLQPEYVHLEIAHFVFQWVQLVAITKPAIQPIPVSKYVIAACFMSKSERASNLAVYLYNSYNDAYQKILQHEIKRNSSVIYLSKPIPVSVNNSDIVVQIDDLEFGYKVSGKTKRNLAIPSGGHVYERCEFSIEWIFEHTNKPFTCDLLFKHNDRKLLDVELEYNEQKPEPATYIQDTLVGREHQIADALGLVMPTSEDNIQLLTEEAQQKYKCSFDRINEALQEIDIPQLIK